VIVRAAAAVLAILTVALAAGPALGTSSSLPSPVPKDSCEQTFGQEPFAGDSRVLTAQVGPSRVRVLLPPAYHTSTRRYPVLYLMHGAQGSADSWLVYSDLVSFTASLPDNRQAVVVMADTSLNSGITLDWADGTHMWETYMVRDLPRWVAAHLRVSTDRGHTAIAGYSGGGYSALHLAAAHPDRYAAVAGFSPVASLSFAGLPGQTALWSVFHAQAVCDGSDPTGPGILPNPVTHPDAWDAVDPVTRAARLRGMSVYLTSGNGEPCEPADAQYAPYGVPLAEAAIRRTVVHLDDALTAQHVPHTTDLHDCGLHWWPWWQRDLRTWWPRFMAATRG
jgi:diacylglycerol O-acyltransferase/trehalose O-mycolyltransferase